VAEDESRVHMRTKLIISGVVFGALIFAVAIRVLVPYYQREYDRPTERATRHEMGTLMKAIELFSEKNSEHRFPTNLTEATPMILAVGESVTTSNLNAVCAKFVYFPPASNLSRNVLSDKVVLVEKLGHYKYRKGGYIGRVDHFEVFFNLDDYKRLIEKSGISLEQLK
jgi:hypothetical protein